MNPTPEASHELLELLRLTGPSWTDRRQWVLRPAHPPSGGSAIHIDHPAFGYFWETRGSRLQAAFFTGGEIPTGPARTLVIEIGGNLLQVHVPGRKALVIGPVEAVIQSRLADLVQEARESRPGPLGEWQHELRIVGCAMRLVALAGDAARAATKPVSHPSHHEELMGQLHDWLQKHIDQPVKLADAAGKFDKSPRQLIRILKDTTGAGFSEHLSMRRLTRARELLMRSSLPVREVASNSGFNSREQFIRSYRRAFGWTPLQFRKAWIRESRSGGRLTELCSISGHQPVRWIPAEQLGSMASLPQTGLPHTLTVANALPEPVELFRITPEGKLARTHILESGAMVFIHRDHGGSLWHVRAPSSARGASFVTPGDHAAAIVSEEPLGS